MIVVDNKRIEDVNLVMLFVLDYKFKKFNTEYIIEDGKITEIIQGNLKVISNSKS